MYLVLLARSSWYFRTHEVKSDRPGPGIFLSGDERRLTINRTLRAAKERDRKMGERIIMMRNKSPSISGERVVTSCHGSGGKAKDSAVADKEMYVSAHRAGGPHSGQHKAGEETD